MTKYAEPAFLSNVFGEHFLLVNFPWPFENDNMCSVSFFHCHLRMIINVQCFIFHCHMRMNLTVSFFHCHLRMIINVRHFIFPLSFENDNMCSVAFFHCHLRMNLTALHFSIVI